jgi:hypothetical protein
MGFLVIPEKSGIILGLNTTAHVHICVYVHVHVHVHMQVSVHVRVNVCVHVRVNLNTHISMYILYCIGHERPRAASLL